MAVMIPREGRVSYLGMILDNFVSFECRLFKNNFNPALITVLADFTIANYSGYVSQVPTWGAIFIDGTDRAVSTATALTFAHNGGGVANDIFGWYLVETVAGKCIGAERLAIAPKNMAVVGDTITITPTITLTQGP